MQTQTPSNIIGYCCNSYSRDDIETQKKLLDKYIKSKGLLITRYVVDVVSDTNRFRKNLYHLISDITQKSEIVVISPSTLADNITKIKEIISIIENQSSKLVCRNSNVCGGLAISNVMLHIAAAYDLCAEELNREEIHGGPLPPLDELIKEEYSEQQENIEDAKMADPITDVCSLIPCNNKEINEQIEQIADKATRISVKGRTKRISAYHGLIITSDHYHSQLGKFYETDFTIICDETPKNGLYKVSLYVNPFCEVDMKKLSSRLTSNSWIGFDHAAITKCDLGILKSWDKYIVKN